MTDPIEIRDAIIDTAVTLAAQKSWEAVRLYDVATALNLSLDQIRPYFREKEDLVDAWFDRADSAMLKQAEAAHFYELSV
ncbi:MAG TPA: TetR family transcriptional regulator, partial [Nitrosomonas sp.]|nr:TetR family transcriptional regulator [Nitrosomonas sp.]